MTWKPSCKTGCATILQGIIVPFEQVLKTLFRRFVSEDAKAGQIEKFRKDVFEVWPSLFSLLDREKFC